VKLDEYTELSPLLNEIHLFVIGAALSRNECSDQRFLDKFRNLSTFKGLLRNFVLLIPIVLWGGFDEDSLEVCEEQIGGLCGYWTFVSFNWKLPNLVAKQLASFAIILLALTS
jgi:hypothetical protein